LGNSHRSAKREGSVARRKNRHKENLQKPETISPPPVGSIETVAMIRSNGAGRISNHRSKLKEGKKAERAQWETDGRRSPP